MPELPEVEVLVRHLDPKLRGRQIFSVKVLRPDLVRPTFPDLFRAALMGRVFSAVRRRAKYLLFDLEPVVGQPDLLVGHLGMTGRMFIRNSGQPVPRHAGVILGLGHAEFIFEDPRRFGRLNLSTSVLSELGPEPWDDEFTVERFGANLKKSRQAIKVRLLDQRLVAGVGNIYASEILFQAGLSPRLSACRLSRSQVGHLHREIRSVLEAAIRRGLSLPLNFAGGVDGLFYHGSSLESRVEPVEFQVYGRARKPCFRCESPIRQLNQGGRSTFYCPRCQTG